MHQTVRMENSTVPWGRSQAEGAQSMKAGSRGGVCHGMAWQRSMKARSRGGVCHGIAWHGIHCIMAHDDHKRVRHRGAAVRAGPL